MADVKPFRGILYNKLKITNLEDVVSPPYDVIPPLMQEELYRRNPYNVIRLILEKEKKNDKSPKDKYRRSTRFLKEWLREKILVKDKKPSFYVYSQEYLHKDKKRERIGFIGLMKIEDPKETGVLPHEYTLSKPKEDRLNVIMNTKANLSPIFSLFQDSSNRINRILKSFAHSKEPLFTLENEGVVNRLWSMQDRKPIKEITSLMNDKKIFIADGHHRYEVALIYRNMMRRTKNFKQSMNYVMMYFSSLSEKENLTILSTHRLIKDIPEFTRGTVIKNLKKYFSLHIVKGMEDVFTRIEKAGRKEYIFGLYMGKNKFYILQLKKEYRIDRLIESDKDYSLMKLEVTILHNFILSKILGLKNHENSIEYIRDENGAKKLVDMGGYQAAFFLRPTDIMDMKSVALKGEMMPQKSTYFYPKLLTGLVINKF